MFSFLFFSFFLTRLRVKARTYDEVVGVDFSGAFIDAARRLRDQGELTYRVRDEGERQVRLPLLPLFFRLMLRSSCRAT